MSRKISEKPNRAKMTFKKRMSLDEKIKILQRYILTGERLQEKTVFEGHSIGRWAVCIRANFRKGKIDLTDEQLTKLKELGILERQIESTIDEKIEALIRWRKKYPEIKIIPKATENTLKKYANTEQEFIRLQEEYDKMHKYYEYIKDRNSRKKLTMEQQEKCKEAFIGGVFYSSKVEEMAKKYCVTQKEVNILEKYGTIENFYTAYINMKITDEEEQKLAGSMIKNVIDIDGKFNKNYDKLFIAIFKKDKFEPELSFYSSEALKKVIEKYLDKKEKRVIEENFGLLDGEKRKAIDKIGEEDGLTKQRISQIRKKALMKLRKEIEVRNECFNIYSAADSQLFAEEEIDEVENLLYEIRLQNRDVNDDETMKGLNLVRKRLEERGIFAENEKGLFLSDLGLSRKAYNCLKRLKARTLYDLSSMPLQEFRQEGRANRNTQMEVFNKMQEYGISFEEKRKSKEELVQEVLERQRIVSEQQQKIRNLKKVKCK